MGHNRISSRAGNRNPNLILYEEEIYYKKLFVMAIITFLIGTILAIISPNFFVLLVGRLVQGIGTAIISSVVAKGQAKLPDDFIAGSLLGCQNAFWIMPIVMILVIVVSTIAVTTKRE